MKVARHEKNNILPGMTHLDSKKNLKKIAINILTI